MRECGEGGQTDGQTNIHRVLGRSMGGGTNTHTGFWARVWDGRTDMHPFLGQSRGIALVPTELVLPRNPSITLMSQGKEKIQNEIFLILGS